MSSSGGSKTFKSSDASNTAAGASSNNDNGFKTTVDYLRSILMHPFGLLLASIFNEVLLCEIIFDCWIDLSSREDLFMYSSCDVRDKIFSSAISEWTSQLEVDLTKSIFSNIEKQIRENRLRGYGTNETSLTIKAEKSVGSNKGRMDFIISKKSDINIQSKPSVVMIVEFGIGHNIWWQKLDQILKYVTLLRGEAEPNYIVDQPILLTVITVARDQSKVGKDNPVARYGVFLYVPKQNGLFRLALLWREDTCNVDNASKQFGKILFAARCCAGLREYVAMKPDFATSYQYLGPNCCRIGSFVSTRTVFLSEMALR